MKRRPMTWRLWVECLFGMLLATVITHPIGYASEEDIANWKTVSIIAQPVSFSEEVKVHAEREDAGWSSKFKVLRIFQGEEELTIPEEALKIVKNPRLETLKISSEAGYNGVPWLYVSFELERPEPGIEWDFPRVYLAFQNGKFVNRFVAKRREDGARDFVDEWEPSPQ